MLHLGRSELYHEANLVLDNPAVIRLSQPVFVCQDRDPVRWPGVCLIQVLTLDARHVTDANGVITVGGRPLWSREVAYSYHRHDQYTAQPTPEQIHHGSFWGGQPVFRKVPMATIAASPQEWRGCDWMTMAMLMPHMDKFVRESARDAVTPCFKRWGDTAVHDEILQYVINNWASLRDIAIRRWPLLEPRVWRDSWRDDAWRTNAVLRTQGSMSRLSTVDGLADIVKRIVSGIWSP